MHAEILDLLTEIAPFDDKERQDIALVRDWVETGTELCRIAKPATPPMHLVSYFPVVCGNRILLVDHKKAGLWLPGGGHVERGEHPRDTVLREVEEELSVGLPFAVEPPVFLTVQETTDALPHKDVSFWYVLKAKAEQKFVFDQEEFYGVGWFDFDAVPQERVEPQLGRFLAKWSANYGDMA